MRRHTNDRSPAPHFEDRGSSSAERLRELEHLLQGGRARVDVFDEREVRLRLGREPIVLPEPLATLVRQLVVTRSGHATLGDQGTSQWLFPGGRPGRPLSRAHLSHRLRELRISPGQARSTALFGLATELPAALLARLLDIHISVAVAWQRASAGDWTSYAADYSRRQHRSNEAAGSAHGVPS